MDVSLLRRTVVIVALALVAGACGSRVDGDPAQALSAAASQGSGAIAGGAQLDPVADPSGNAHEDPSNAAEERSGNGANGAASAQESQRAGSDDTVDPSSDDASPAGSTMSGIVTSIEPACVEIPGRVSVTTQSVPLADVAYGAAFADGSHHGQWGLGVADQQGRFVWTITVGVDVPPGPATFSVAAAHPENGGGTGKGSFAVAERGGCS